MKPLFKDFMSNKALFFDLLDKAAKNIVEMALLLVSAVNNEVYNDRAEIFNQIEKMEHTADGISRKINLWLDKVIFPPLNRNDIHDLSSKIHDVADTIKEAGSRIYLYNMDASGPALKEIANIILQASLELEKAVSLLHTSKKPNQVFDICRKIKNYQRQAGQVYYRALQYLFNNEKDTIKIVKEREILLSLETSVTKCKNVTDVLNAILVNSI
jgi:predicted phosphate transport protein (TIGR00153 family)